MKMNAFHKSWVFAAVVMMGVIRPVCGQGSFTYFSTLDTASSNASLPISQDLWVAQGFLTGDNPGGYTLDSIDLLMGDADGNPGGGFTVSLYSNGVRIPGENIGTLAGSSDPSVAGIYTYSGEGLVLEGSTAYFIVASSSSADAGSYAWKIMELSPRTDPATIADDGWYATFSSRYDGTDWLRGSFGYRQFGINAIAIPEPSTLALIGTGAAFLALRRRRRRKV